MRDKTLALQAEHPIAGGDPIDFPVEAHALFHSRLLLGGCGYNHGSQCTRHHGQGRTEEADREHEISGVHGTVASLEEHRGVSAPQYHPNTSVVVVSIIPRIHPLSCLYPVLLPPACLRTFRVFANLMVDIRQNILTILALHAR